MIAMTLDDIAQATGGEIAKPCDASCDPILRIATDSREVRPGDLFVAIRGDRLDGHEYIEAALDRGASGCVCDRQWFDSLPAPAPPTGTRATACLLVVDDTVEMLGRLAAHYRTNVMSPGTVVIAITGTNGKTTTKAMLDHLLAPWFPGRAAPRSFNNAIGVPLTILSADAEDRYLIIEIGSSSPGEVDALARIAAPNAAVITSIGEAHLEGLGDLAGVVREKASLLDHVRSDGLVVVNVDQSRMRDQVDRRTGPRVVTIGSGADASLLVSIVESDVRQTTLELEGRIRATVPMPGRHHASNAAAAFAVARWFGVPPQKIIEGLATFVPLEGRTRSIDLSGIQLIDDAYNANPTSMGAVVEGLAAISGRRRVFVMGDMLELGEAAPAFHTQIVESAFAAGIEVLVAVGSRSVQATERIARSSRRTRVITCDDASDAITKVAAEVRSGDVVWVKGSRGIGLDRVVADLMGRYSAATATTAVA